MTEKWDDAASGIRRLLVTMGEDPDRNGLVETPGRVTKAMLELTWGLRENEPSFLKNLQKHFDVDTNIDQMIVVHGIYFTSLCEHHLLPFIGHASVAYLPEQNADNVIGISKPARLVQFYAARPQVQERLTAQIATAMGSITKSENVAVFLRAEHFCMSLRGPKVPGAVTVTSDMRGAFRNKPEVRAEFLELAREKHV